MHDTIAVLTLTPAPLAPALESEIPEITNFTRFTPIFKVVVRHKNNIFYEDRVVLAGPAVKYGKLNFSFQPLKDIHLDAGTAEAGGFLLLHNANKQKKK